MENHELLITALDMGDHRDTHDSSLTELADQMLLMGAHARLESQKAADPTKGAETVISIGLSAATLRELGRVLSPIIVAWITRPRKYDVSVTLGSGAEKRRIVFSSTGVGHEKFSDGLARLAAFVSDASDGDDPDR